MTSSRTGAALVGEEVEREAMRWAGPFGYALVQVLRMSDHYSDADFLALLERGRALMGQPAAGAAPGQGAEGPALSGQAVAGLVLDPLPGQEHYRPPTGPVPGRAGQPAPPPGRRDASGRIVRRAR